MAQKRYVSSNFWKDNYITDLDPSEKLVFLYLLTNPQANIAGVYELTIREMAFDTGYDKDMIVKILGRFERDDKIIHKKGWIVMKNWIKHQSLNPNMKTGVEKILDSLPKWLLEELESGKQQSLIRE
jgi:hypothetical protein